ncbi:hypothetical protein CONLIGDRAFT_693912 [Coniochaeta ligniaria NRRL 30616]|uniref:Uncharacterized protein n=1 Tax=Coniochaeta ligniaria NRRL 30616 TaxID=1408157 RepID=A0A1J7I7E7_9PEZI|nr:hypothetical protein CONLIGDRAFT_693912 [Coniochaeta ligniaria NRRL 30616]
MSSLPITLSGVAVFADLGDPPSNNYRKFTKPLKSIRKATLALTQDVLVITNKYFEISRSPEAEAFLRSCDFYHVGLLRTPFAGAKEKLRPSWAEPLQVVQPGRTIGDFSDEIETDLEVLAARIQGFKANTTKDSWGLGSAATQPRRHGADGITISTPLRAALCVRRAQSEDQRCPHHRARAFIRTQGAGHTPGRPRRRHLEYHGRAARYGIRHRRKGPGPLRRSRDPMGPAPDGQKRHDRRVERATPGGHCANGGLS